MNEKNNTRVLEEATEGAPHFLKTLVQKLHEQDLVQAGGILAQDEARLLPPHAHRGYAPVQLPAKKCHETVRCFLSVCMFACLYMYVHSVLGEVCVCVCVCVIERERERERERECV